MELKADQRVELRVLVDGLDTPAPAATRARMVLWRAENRQKKEIAKLAGALRPTVDLWLSRYEAEGIAHLVDRPRDTSREQMPATKPDSRPDPLQPAGRDRSVALVEPADG